MFFLVRSAFCIGLVACLLPASQRPVDWRGLAEVATSEAAAGLGSFCAVPSAACAEAGIAGLAAASLGATASRARKSLDTLRPADRVPAWGGPSTQS